MNCIEGDDEGSSMLVQYRENRMMRMRYGKQEDRVVQLVMSEFESNDDTQESLQQRKSRRDAGM